jgi:hypothetical protein
VVYGTLTPLNSWNPVWGNFKNYTTLWRDMRDAKGWREKLYIVFAPPGLINTNTNSSVQTPEPITQRFATPVTRWQQIYGWLASGVVLALVIELLRVAPDLSWPARVVFTVTIILNTAGLSRIFEGRAGAVKLEASRCLLMFGCLGAGMWFYPLPDIARFLAVGILMVSLVLLFLLQRDQSSTITQNFMETA